MLAVTPGLCLDQGHHVTNGSRRVGLQAVPPAPTCLHIVQRTTSHTLSHARHDPRCFVSRTRADASRNYPENKLQENVTSEIMQVVLNETRESYAEEIIVVLNSSGKDDGEMDDNVRRLDEWAVQWVKDHAEGEDAE